MSALFHIVKNTFRENLREPIFLLVTMAAVVLIGLFPTMTLFVFREQTKLVVDSSMATSLTFGWILAVIIAGHAVTREIETGTALLMLSKPVDRTIFILGKILGILLSLAVFCFITSVATLISVRIAKDQFRIDLGLLGIYFGALAVSCISGGLRNFLTNKSFPMAAMVSMAVIFPLALIPSELAAESERFYWPLVPASILVSYAVLTMGILATSLSTRFNLVPNLALCACVFIVGTMSDYLFGQYADTSIVANVLYALIPNWQLFWMADALAVGKTIPWAYVAYGAIYIILFMGMFLGLAVLLFRNREVGIQNQV